MKTGRVQTETEELAGMTEYEIPGLPVITDAGRMPLLAELWKLVHAVQNIIDKDGSLLVVGIDNNPREPLAAIRKLADELDPEYGRF